VVGVGGELDVLTVDLLQQEIGASRPREEGVGQMLGGDGVPRNMALRPRSFSQDLLGRLADGLAEITKSVGELLQFGAVAVDEELPLVEAAACGTQRRGTRLDENGGR